ncbi:MAG: DUF5317 domain-containing protein [Armatimonadetes bacterium]|nr:DUF5317 domain-containing protein [Armatimonadota bacterium]
MILEVMLAAIALGLLLGGKLHRLAEPPVRHIWVIYFPVVLMAAAWVIRQRTAVPSSSWIFGGLHMAGIITLVLACGLNQRIAGIKLIMAGLTLNAIAIAVNGGFMPVSRGAVASLFGKSFAEQALSGPHVRSIPIDAGTRMYWLCDIIPKGGFIKCFNGVYSVGDVLMSLGVFIAIIAIMRTPIPRGKRT